MKVVIEVPKDQYEWIKEHKGETDYQTTEMLYNCVRKGTLFDEVEGHWISSYPDVEPNPMFMYETCSVCGFEQSISNKLKFCPNCGTKMSSEDEFDNLEEMLEYLWNATVEDLRNDTESEVENMTLDEAIAHCEKVADGFTEQGKCAECAAEHRQLASWLRELKDARETIKAMYGRIGYP